MEGMSDDIFRQAVLEHAKFLGMADPEGADAKYLYIAEEALTAPLPPNWEQGVSDDGTPYHFNSVTGESIWEHPRDEEFRQMYIEKKKEHSSKGRARDSTKDTKKESSAAKMSSGKKQPEVKTTTAQSKTADNVEGDMWIADIVAEMDSDEGDVSGSFEASKPYVPSAMTPQKKTSRPQNISTPVDDSLSNLAKEVDDLNAARHERRFSTTAKSTPKIKKVKPKFSSPAPDVGRYDKIQSSSASAHAIDTKDTKSHKNQETSTAIRDLKRELEFERAKSKRCNSRKCKTERAAWRNGECGRAAAA